MSDQPRPISNMHFPAIDIGKVVCIDGHEVTVGEHITVEKITNDFTAVTLTIFSEKTSIDADALPINVTLEITEPFAPSKHVSDRHAGLSQTFELDIKIGGSVIGTVEMGKIDIPIKTGKSDGNSVALHIDQEQVKKNIRAAVRNAIEAFDV